MSYRNKIKRKLLSIHNWNLSHDRLEMEIISYNDEVKEEKVGDMICEMKTAKEAELVYKYSGKKIKITEIQYATP